MSNSLQHPQANPLKTPLTYLKGVGPQRADVLAKELNLFTVEDLLQHYPFRYVDKTEFKKIGQLNEELGEAQIVGIITHVEEVGSGKGRKRLVAQLVDDSGSMELIWFQSVKIIKGMLLPHAEYVVYGKLNKYGRKFSIVHPEMELKTQADLHPEGSLYPVYHSTEKLSAFQLHSKGIARIMETALNHALQYVGENLPPKILAYNKFMDRQSAVAKVHFPKNTQELQAARYRLKYEELFFVQLALLRQKVLLAQKNQGFVFTQSNQKYLSEFYKNHLPFSLTQAQIRVLKEIRADVSSGRQMNRLLQGDVGSGKTIVALLAALMAMDAGFQACLMAPTEILAKQHFEGLSELVKDLPIRVDLLTGSSKTKKRNLLHEALRNGQIHLLIGTHALIEDEVQFQNLGLAIIDEQHRFGVAQRQKLWAKNRLHPHVLVMTATPIPRTLAMTVYGDLDVSVIDELPPGRKPIKTLHYFENKRLALIGFLKEEIAKGRQVYVVYPLIEESEKMDYLALSEGLENIQRDFPEPQYRISMVHGKLPPEQKDEAMQEFVSGKSHIMVATTVIEVGVNVPNASVMVIESAERFGLSQLHQLRGRVGRGAEQSYCILMTGYKLSKESKTRLETMTRTQDGFEIAEVDLKLRGPGDLMGTRQSGVLDLKLAEISKDGAILQMARDQVSLLLQNDPELTNLEHQKTKEFYKQKYSKRYTWGKIS